MDSDSEANELDLDIKRVTNFMGVKELRRKHGLPEELEEGDVILNPVWQQAQQAALMQEQQEANDEAAASEPDMWDTLDDEAEAVEKGHPDANPFMKEFEDFVQKELMIEEAA